MSIAELSAILIAVTGLYLALCMPDGEQSLSVGPLRLTNGLSAGVFAVSGLLTLLAINTQPAAWWNESADAIESAIFWLATSAALGGAYGLIRATTSTGQMQSGVALAAGGTCLFGTVGDTLAAVACLAVIGCLGWKLQTAGPQFVSSESLEDTNREPLLVTVSAILLVWLLTSAVHSSVTDEVRPAARSQNPRALPRPFLRDSGETTNADASAEADDAQTWRLIAGGLLVTTAGIAIVAPRGRDIGPPTEPPENSKQVSS